LIRLDRPIVNSFSQPAEPVGVTAHGLLQRLRTCRPHIDEPLDSAIPQSLGGDWSHSPQRVDG